MAISREKLEAKAKAFAQAYVTNGFNMAAAAQAVGYKGSVKVRSLAGARMLNQPICQHYMQKYQQEAQDHGYTPQRVVKEICELAAGTIKPFLAKQTLDLGSGKSKDVVLVDITTPEAEAAIATVQEISQDVSYELNGAITVRTRLKLHSKLEALRDLAKIHRLYNDEKLAQMAVSFNQTNIFIDDDAKRAAAIAAIRQANPNPDAWPIGLRHALQMEDKK